MASRVTVNVRVRDESRAGLRAVRNNIRSLNDDIRRSGRNAQFMVTINAASAAQARRRVARLRRDLAGLPVGIRVNLIQPDRGRTRSIARAIGRGLLAPLRILGRFLGGVLSDGLGQGLVAGFRAAGPAVGSVLAVILAAAILGAMSFLGAAIAGILVLAIGGAFTVLGGALVFLSEKVRKRWSDTLDRLKPLFADAAKPMEPVVEHIRQKLEQAAKAFAPHFKQALAGASPHVQTFFDRIMEGFKKLGDRAAGPLEEAFNVLLAALGPDLEDMLAGLGDSLAALANTVSEHSSEISAAITGIIGLITTAIDIINFFAQAWVFMQRSAGTAMANIIFGLANVVDASFNAVIAILGAFSKIPFIGDQFKLAQQAVTRFKDGVVSDMRQSGNAILAANAAADKINKERRLRVNIASWNSQLAVARGELKKTTSQKAEAKVRANINDLIQKLARAEQALANLNGKTATTYVNTVYSSLNNTKRDPKTGRVYRAHGGVVGTAATGGVRNNMTMVGEQGPELVDLPSGSRVRSNPDTNRILGGGGGGGGMTPMLLIVKIGETEIAELLLDGPLPKAVKRRGGVEAAFGKL